MRGFLFVLAWLFLCGFTMPIEWTVPANADFEGFIIEYKPEHGGWRTLMTVARADRLVMITEDRPGQHCYRVRSQHTDGSVRSGPSRSKCGYNENKDLWSEGMANPLLMPGREEILEEN